MKTYEVDIIQREVYTLTVKAHNATEASQLAHAIVHIEGSENVCDEAWEATAEYHDVHPDALGEGVWDTLLRHTDYIEVETGTVEEVEE